MDFSNLKWEIHALDNCLKAGSMVVCADVLILLGTIFLQLHLPAFGTNLMMFSIQATYWIDHCR